MAPVPATQRAMVDRPGRARADRRAAVGVRFDLRCSRREKGGRRALPFFFFFFLTARVRNRNRGRASFARVRFGVRAAGWRFFSLFFFAAGRADQSARARRCGGATRPPRRGDRRTPPPPPLTPTPLPFRRPWRWRRRTASRWERVPPARAARTRAPHAASAARRRSGTRTRTRGAPVLAPMAAPAAWCRTRGGGARRSIDGMSVAALELPVVLTHRPADPSIRRAPPRRRCSKTGTST